MNIESRYQAIGDSVLYSDFVCELDNNTLLKFEFVFDEEAEKKCRIIMEDKVSGIVDISAYVDVENVKSIIKILRVVAMQLQEMEK